MINEELTLVIGDSHVTDGQDLGRFEALGYWIEENQPETILSIGDFLDVKSLSAWDMNKRLLMEGRRYAKEIEAGNEALDLLQGPTYVLQEQQREGKRKLYKPKWIYIEGNHEWRIGRYIEQHPELEGHIDYIKELKLKERGFIHIPYKEYYLHNGIAFTHVPISGNGSPRSGSIYNQLNYALAEHQTSIVWGHTHKLAIAGIHRHGSEHYNQAMSVGCFFEHMDEYAKGASTNYWRGIVILYHYEDNRFDIETMALSRLKREYLT